MGIQGEIWSYLWYCRFASCVLINKINDEEWFEKRTHKPKVKGSIPFLATIPLLLEAVDVE